MAYIVDRIKKAIGARRGLQGLEELPESYEPLEYATEYDPLNDRDVIVYADKPGELTATGYIIEGSNFMVTGDVKQHIECAAAEAKEEWDPDDIYKVTVELKEKAPDK